MSRGLELAVSRFLVLGRVAAACSDGDETSTPAVQPSPAEQADQMGSMDIVATAVAAGDFDALVAAVEAAGLADTLAVIGRGPNRRCETVTEPAFLES